MKEKQSKKYWTTTIRLNTEKHQDCIGAFEGLKAMAEESGVPFYQLLCRAVVLYYNIRKMSEMAENVMETISSTNSKNPNDRT